MVDKEELLKYFTNPLFYGFEDIDNDGMSDQYETDCGISNGGWQDPNVCNDRYAILIAEECDQVPNDYNIKEYLFWYDLVDVYDILVDDYFYDPDNIFVLYGGSSIPFIPNNYRTDIAIYDYVNQLNLADLIDNELENIIDSNDFLYIHLNGHDSGTMIAGIYNVFLKNQLDTLSYAKCSIVLESCNSGGFIANVEGNDHIILSSSKSGEYGFEADNRDYLGNVIDEGSIFYWESSNTYDTYYHTEFMLQFLNSLSKCTEEYFIADTNDDNYVSILEAFTYSYNHDSARTQGWLVQNTVKSQFPIDVTPKCPICGNDLVYDRDEWNEENEITYQIWRCDHCPGEPEEREYYYSYQIETPQNGLNDGGTIFI